MDKLADLSPSKTIKRMQGDGMPGQPAPIEDVELAGEKDQLQDCAAPGGFLYSFSGPGDAFGKEVESTMSDLTDICTKDILQPTAST
jgi:hypothetical protein